MPTRNATLGIAMIADDCGLGVKEDYAEAVKWYRKAAEQGQAEAQFTLGLFYYCGNGVKQDYTEAVKWYRKAAEQGDADAQCNLGYCYDCGHGVKQDYRSRDMPKRSSTLGFAIDTDMA